MNKVYSLKYCPSTGCLIAVSELVRRVTKKTSRKLKNVSLISITTICVSCTFTAQAGMVRSDIAYQIYRDFAENKGLFIPGATDIPVYDKDDKLLGQLNKAPMADFSSVSTNGVATLVSPQYIVSVKHNGSYRSVGFGNGENTYTLVDRNDHPSVDFHSPRLNKLVTEVIPSSVTAEGIKKDAYKNTERYTAFYRVGSGMQYTKDKNGHLTNMGGVYSFKTGGTIGVPLISDATIVSNPGDTYNNANGILANYGLQGDSGSPLFAYDSAQKKWVIVAVLRSYNNLKGITNWWNVVQTDFLNQRMQEDFSLPIKITSSKEPVNWTYNSKSGTGILSQGSTKWTMHGQKGNNLNAGKNLIFSGENSEIILKDNITQGAGYLRFSDNYTLSASSKETWTGAGIITDKGTSVTWKVNGVASDNLHKLGEGTLVINGTGENPGGLNTGDGTVLLEQRADTQGNVQAFSSINLASGRPTVVLGDARQINPDNISWGYRGGKLDLNGNAITFTRLQAADYGAIITNNAQKKSHLLLNMSGSQNSDASVQVPIGTILPMGGTGIPGNLYSQTVNKKTRYYILKSASYGPTLGGGSLNDPKQWEFAGTDKNKAIQAVKARGLTEREKQPVIYHGQLTGNMDVTIPKLPDERKVIFDGSVNLPEGTLSKEGGSLIFQGHPVTHASVNGSAPVSLTQKDWETRHFELKTLSLKSTNFHLSRNAALNGSILSENSHIILGSSLFYIDKNDGTGHHVKPEEGNLSNIKNEEPNHSNDNKTSNNPASVSETTFSGQIISTGGSVTVGNQTNVILTKSSSMDNTDVTIEKGGVMNVQGGLFTNKETKIAGTMNLTGKQEQNNSGTSIYIGYGGYKLTEDNAQFTVKKQAAVIADIKSDKAAIISLGQEKNTVSYAPVNDKFALGLLNGFDSSLEGAIKAPLSTLNMNNSLWKITGNSSIKKMNSSGSMIYFQNNKDFSTLTVDKLTADNSAFIMRTNLRGSDQLVVNNDLTGKNNLLLLDFIEKKEYEKNGLNIELVKAPANTNKDVFKTENQTIGFSHVIPEIKQELKDNKSVWTLTGYKALANTDAERKATTLMSGNYKAFLTEVNNLNKRMGDLRDTNGEAGAWARIMSGAGSASGGYSDNYTHVQIGADKKHQLGGLDLFTGLTMTYTDSHASSNAFSGKTKSVGAGLYASAMFDSGAYIDLIGKYVHHDNEYTATFAGLGTRNYGTHSWYAGAETGYRYHLNESTWIEPQAELVYGVVSGKQFSWQDRGMNVTMKNKAFNPLIGRTGIDVGKTFSGKEWKMTAKAGIGYQFDLLKNGGTLLRDASGEKRIKGEKDRRMLMNVGLNAEAGDNVRLGMEFEKSAFGKYNVDNSVNVNFRYSF
ncbi:autotransporter outer membrane beta-barrel domain-containing protein [Escherichia coli]|uniref:S6 family peptidase n=1 Tax=Escherichia coli TaxID=562 RepID=UPI002AC63581|nr:S6 family peptidase [Escherichia coli]MDZ4888766.1 autotransporter outer membrane beta-barrel domain-containing protein [Escherichia coli]MDZ4930326.1 autotransporter outer membrane beta-barrel domain-containing protein [Escherichia coli]MDZ4953946.1 autotransporter outer membrane beta-barrel domain-containing protein [Escherichia coli]MDZ4962162.1 autotransporter outer membrane beta-barrel domain-containing protein [Escherichia coli]MDZ4988333.1 autotransporter outer membrane beta-barrel d